MPGRTIAIADVHGCLAALSTVLQAIEPRPDDTIITLGDYVDRGPDSRGVIERLITLAGQCRLVPILGNHDEMFLDVCTANTSQLREWLLFGGDATSLSYDGMVPQAVPPEHVDFLKQCRSFYETDRHLFVHASYLAHLPLDEQPVDVLRWESLKIRRPGPHCSGKTAIVGHTAQASGEILDLGYLQCIDTRVYGSGWLTALNVDSGQLWQADKQGRLRP